MKTSWLNGSKRILSALLIAAALMFGWTPLGDGKALAATDKGKQFAQAAMLFAKTEVAYAQEIYKKRDVSDTPFFSNTYWCAAFVSVIARQLGISTSVIPDSAGAKDFAPATSSFHPMHVFGVLWVFQIPDALQYGCADVWSRPLYAAGRRYRGAE